MLTASCTKLLKWTPEPLSDSSDVKITCDAREGNKGLINYNGDVYVHIGLITSESKNKDDWRFVKFKWGSRDIGAQATPAGNNKWSYTIKNIRKFFGVGKDEQIINLAILFRSGGCIDIYCKVLRNSDGSNMYIPIDDKPANVSGAAIMR
jgi:hypothetical protein